MLGSSALVLELDGTRLTFSRDGRAGQSFDPPRLLSINYRSGIEYGLNFREAINLSE
jgi:hypothetical protein